MSWWAPLAIVGGAIAGLVFGYGLLVATGARGSRRSPGASKVAYRPADRGTEVVWNPAAFLVVGGLVALIVGLALGLSLS